MATAASVSTRAATASATKRGATDVSFHTSDDVKIAATLYAPVSRRAPAVMLLHMAYGSRQDWDTYAQRLQTAGFVVLAIDLRGHGESGGDKDWEKMTQDAAAAWKYLNAQAQVVSDRIIIVGASIGANVALNFGAAQPGIKAVGLLSPGLNYFNVTTEGALKKYGARPVLMFSSSEDEYAAASQKKLEPLATGPKRTQIFQNIGHGTDMLKDIQLADALFDWLVDTAT